MKQFIKKWNWNKVSNNIILIFSFLLAACMQEAKGQVNLIKNPSFEDTIQITLGSWGQECIVDWHNLDSSRPQNCAFGFFSNYQYLNNQYKLPNSAFVYTFPRNGDNILNTTAFWKFYFTPAPVAVRSVASSSLKLKLQTSKKYCAKAWVTPSEYQGYYTNGFGMYFDNGQLDTIVAKDSSGIYPFVTPQVQAPNIINDTAGWTLVSGTFIANGTETHIHLGNWLSDSATLKQPNYLQICECEDIFIDDVSLIPVDIANWLRDTSVTLTDSVYIGLPKYEVPDAVWYTYNMQPIDTASGIWVKPTQAITQYIQAIDVCDKVAYDTVTVYAYPLSNVQLTMNNLQLKVFPNPATNSINVTCLSFLNNQEKLQILDVTGKEIQHFIPNNKQMEIDISGLANGLYVVKYGSKSVKFVKE